ncbi:MAG TPA: hypothetical protein VGH04_08510 [Gemmatimonadaceae bacterium]
MIVRGFRVKARNWLTRYGLAECAGITCALLASAIVRRLTSNPIAAAYAGAWGETLGYSALIAVRDAMADVRRARLARSEWGVRSMGRLLAAWGMEFGPSGLLDTLLTRPACMGLGIRLLGPVRGLVLGKLAADVLFYIPVIFMYERRGRSAA